MAVHKQYGSLDIYERKLANVMTRLGTESYDWDCNRTECWVEFVYKGQPYRFEHSISKAKEHNISLPYGSDAFAQLVLALEDLARIVERGIYDLASWVSGMKALPATVVIPQCFQILGFDRMPTSLEEAQKAYRKKVKLVHPDAGGNAADFAAVQQAFQAAQQYLNEKA